jgi:hypothetical protein
MTDQLSLYNGALRCLGEARLATLTEAVESRRELDAIWDDGAIDDCLDMGHWNFATRTVQASYDPDVTPSFGFTYGYSKPTDWIKTCAIASDEYFRNPLTDLDYKDEGGRWWSDLDSFYVSFISNDSGYGMNFALWPTPFVKLVEAYMANELAPRLRKSQSGLAEAEVKFKNAKLMARNSDAMNEGAKFAPAGSWANSRAGRRGRNERGRRGSLIG